MAVEEVVVKIENVSKMYRLFGNKSERMKEALHPFKKKYHKEFFALHNINLQIKKGEILGVVGMNGSGKSTLLKIVAGIIKPSEGSIKVTGNVVPLLELGSGFNPEFSGLENIYFYNSILGYNRKKTDEIVKKILDFAEIGDFIYQPLKTYSSGMKARLSFAVSVNIDPDILIVDEILSVGDELFRRKSFSKMEDFFKAGKTILFVSHSEAQINQLCSRAIMLHRGNIVLDGLPKTVTMNYNKYMFSNSAQKENLLQEFRRSESNIFEELSTIGNLKFKESQSINLISGDDTLGTSYYMPDFVSKSTVHTLNAKLEPTDFAIKQLSGAKVNVLARNEEFEFSYKVHFREDVGRLNFGIGFKNETGVPLSWRVFPGKSKYLDRLIKSGDTLAVHWKFKCKLLPGTYFINTGIRNERNGLEFLLYKGADILAFKVVEGDISKEGGLFDISLSGSMYVL